MSSQASPPRPTPSSRMALSALVNSPVERSRPLSPSPTHYPPSSSYHPNGAGSRYISPERPYAPTPARVWDEPPNPIQIHRSRTERSPAYYAYQNGHTHSHSQEHRRSRSPVRAMRLGDKLVGNEEVWEAGLQQYQRKREAEVDDLAVLLPSDLVGHSSIPPIGPVCILQITSD